MRLRRHAIAPTARRRHEPPRCSAPTCSTHSDDDVGGWAHVGIVRGCARVGLEPYAIAGSNAGAAIEALGARADGRKRALTSVGFISRSSSAAIACQWLRRGVLSSTYCWCTRAATACSTTPRHSMASRDQLHRIDDHQRQGRRQSMRTTPSRSAPDCRMHAFRPRKRRPPERPSSRSAAEVTGSRKQCRSSPDSVAVLVDDVGQATATVRSHDTVDGPSTSPCRGTRMRSWQPRAPKSLLAAA